MKILMDLKESPKVENIIQSLNASGQAKLFPSLSFSPTCDLSCT